MRRPIRTSATILALSAALVTGGVAVAAPASADSAPTDPSNPKTPTTVTADALATPQIDGVVWSQVISGNTVFAGGQFTTARPYGSAAGINTVTRNNLLSYNVTTGVLNTGFAPSLNAQVKEVVASADGKYIYAAGSFTSVSGVTRNRVVKLDATTGAVVTAFAVSANSTVSALALSGNTLYLGGAFSNVAPASGQTASSRTQLAAVDATTGAILPWAPKAVGGGVTALTVNPDGSKIVIGGAFTTLNGSGNPGYGLAAVDTSGTLLPWSVNNKIRNGGANAGITSLTSDATGVYGTGYVFGAGGTLEGTFRSDWSGNLVWVADCHGDTYSTAVTDDAVYSAGHSHYCGTLQGFPQTNPVWTFHRATAFSKNATLTLTAQPFGGAYTSYAGTPGPSLLNWNPELTPGTYTGKTQAAWSVAANDKYVVYGGEFPSVNGTAQQGLVRFAVPSLATNKQGPLRTGANFQPNLVSTTPGRVKVSWVANSDRDNATLTYALYRDGNTTTPIYTATQDSSTWLTPQMGFTDSGLAAGSTHSYRLRVTDPFGNTVLGNSVSVSVASAAPSGYLGQVLGDGASNFWRLDESSGSLVHDYAGYYDQVAGTGVTRNTAGAIAGGDSASTFSGTQASNGTSTSFSSTQALTTGPQVFTQEAWFKTTSTAGGKIVGFGDQSAGYSNSFDRHLYMTTDGKVSFGVYNGSQQAIVSPTALNNSQWHQVVGTLSSAGMRLYVDGALVGTKTGVTSAQGFNGYWRIGGDATWSGGRWFAGSIDDVAIYPSALSAGQIATHYSVGKNGGGTTPPPSNQSPTASFTTSASGLGVTVNGAGSSDPDGSVASYGWTFGDGGTATGATASHAYATDGTYTVQLTVTDNDGASASTTRSVTVTGGTTTPPATGAIAADAFQRTVSNGWGTADTGGAWTRSGAATSFSVAPGTGSILLIGPGAQAGNTLASVSQTSADLTSRFSLSTVATGGGTQVSLQGRKVGSTDYRATVLLKNNGTAAISLVGASSTIAPAVVIPGTIVAGTSISTRLQVTGTNPTTVRAKAWVTGTAEPSAWTVSTTDSTAALQAAGSVGILAYESGSATNGAQTLRVTAFTAVAP